MNSFLIRIPVFPILLFLIVTACRKADRELPILGNMEVIDGDTVYHTIPDFRFINQDSQIITPQTFEDKIYVADFFFTSCPSICPKVKKQMLRLYEKYKDNPDILILSHSIDVIRDSVPRLRIYSENLGVSPHKWHFVTGDKDKIFSIANDYFVSAMEDPSAPGGFDHSGRLILVDREKHVRSYCNGTDPEEVTQFMLDIDALLESYQ